MPADMPKIIKLSFKLSLLLVYNSVVTRQYSTTVKSLAVITDITSRKKKSAPYAASFRLRGFIT